MIDDAARRFTDDELKRAEERMRREFQRAYDTLNDKWAGYMAEHSAESKRLLEAVDAARESGSKTAVRRAEQKYRRYMKEHTLEDGRYQQLRNTLAATLADIDEAAAAILNGQLPSIYTVNFNALASELPAGYTYGLITPQTVRNLTLRTVDYQAIVKWNIEMMNSQVLQGILLGESMDDIARRFEKVFNANYADAIRTARTAVTQAENQGRYDSYKEAEADGTVLVKVWSATADARTRDSHAENNGLERELDQPFPNGQMLPGDTDGVPPSEYMNCRCALGTRIIGFRRKDGSIRYV